MTKPSVSIGDRFSRLQIVGRAPNTKSGKSMWECLCDCGNITIVAATHLRAGGVKSCGCLRDELLAERQVTHGFSNHPLYRRWAAIVQRCTNPNVPHFCYYGGRGISVYEDWKTNPEKFIFYVQSLDPFWEEKINLGYQIDRISNNGNYEPGNIRLVTSKENNANRRNRDTAGVSLGTTPGMNKNVKVLTGLVFGRLLVISRNKDNSKQRRAQWNCICVCGNRCVVMSSLLTEGKTKSCGCLNREVVSEKSKTHGLRDHPAYAYWSNLKQREKKGKIALDPIWQKDFTVFLAWLESKEWSVGRSVKSDSNLFNSTNCYLSN